MEPVSTRRLIAVRRALVFAGFLFSGVALVKFQNPLFLLMGGLLVGMIYTDLCGHCGAVLFFQRGRTTRDRLNALHVPPTCSRCGAEI